MRGYIHLYCGNGKGKTTAAMGLVLRQISNQKKVVIAQFLKDGSSSEILFLKKQEHVTYLNEEMPKRFFKQMDSIEKEKLKQQQNQLFHTAVKKAEQANCLILDEIIDAIKYSLIDIDECIHFLQNRNPDLEVILTGRNPDEKIIACSDYYTDFICQKHPYTKGVTARIGIEY